MRQRGAGGVLRRFDADDPGGDMSAKDLAGRPDSSRRGRRAWRFWWVTAAIVVLAIAGAVMTTLDTATTYTGRSSMIVSSNNRSPDQDAVLVQGYVDYFNNVAYQSELLEQAGVERPLGVTARAAAASPIMVIEVTTPSLSTARPAATAIAEAFREDINQERDREQQAEIASLQTRIDEFLAAPVPGSDNVVSLLQDRIVTIQADRTNELQVLQLSGGVATTTPSLVTNVVLAALGGLIIGILAALGLDRLLLRRTERS